MPSHWYTDAEILDFEKQKVFGYFRNLDRSDVQKALKRTIEFSDEIQHEDIAICEAVQRGLRSRTYTSGRYSVKRENGVHHFHGLLTEFLARQ